jgi:hypothetical protein
MVINSLWKKRRPDLVHAYSVAAWLVSPISEVREDSKLNKTGEHILIVEGLLAKLYKDELGDFKNLGDLYNKFWEEYEQFSNMTGVYSGRNHIWISNDVQDGRSHFWHKKNTLPFTSIFGKLACQVCSKIIGIGSAERGWGDVKHLKTEKRSHLGAKAVQMQATIYGSSCTELAKVKRDLKREDGVHADQLFWNDDDLAKDLGLEKFGEEIQLPKSKVRVFKAYWEKWEEELYKKEDVEVETRFLMKYGGLSWYDPDKGEELTANPEKMEFSKVRGSRGYCILAMADGVEEGDWEPWDIRLTIPMIVEYHNNRLKVIEKDDDDDVDGN